MKKLIIFILILTLSLTTPFSVIAGSDPQSPASCKTVTVCILDSGSNTLGAHGWNYLTDNADITDNAGHGTRVYELLSSLATKADIITLKCFEESMSFDEDAVVRALYAAVDDYGADVINMSWTVNVESEALYEAVRHAFDNGAILVAPVGNLSLSTRLGAKTWPAAWDEVIGVGGVNLDDSGAPKPSLAYLRGESVYVCADAEYQCAQTGKTERGSSYAAPRVSAMIAKYIMYTLHDSCRGAQCAPADDQWSPLQNRLHVQSIDTQGITQESIRQMLKNTAQDLCEPSYDTTTGWGYIEAGGYKPPLR